MVESVDPALERAGRPAFGQAGADREGATLELREEELVAEKQVVQMGVVRISKRVVTETRTVEVVVSREEVVAERLPSDAATAHSQTTGDGDGSAQQRVQELKPGETIRLQLVEEEIVVQKRPVFYEEVVVGKREVEESQTFAGTVRREEARITSTGDLNLETQRDTAPRSV